MVDVITGLYDFTLPEVGGSDDTWGDKLNANWLKMETLLAGTFIGGTPTSLGSSMRLNAGGAVSYVEITPINVFDPLNQIIRFGRSSPVGNLNLTLYNPGTTTVRVVLKSEGTGSVTAGVGEFGSIFIGANPAGAAVTSLISGATGVAPNIRSGVATGQLVNFSDSAAATVAFIAPAGTAAPGAAGVITQEKGDARYLNLAGNQTITGTNVIENTSPILRWHETDAVSPGGQYALGGGSAGDFYFWRFSAANFATSVVLWSYDLGLNRFNFTPPVLFSTTIEVTTSIETPYIFGGNQSFSTAGDVSGFALTSSIFQLHPRDGLSSSGAAIALYRAGVTVFYVNRSGSLVTVGSLNAGDNITTDDGLYGGWLNVSGTVTLTGVYAKTTANAANQYINTLFELYRSTSSGKFKTKRTPIPNPGAIIDALDPLSFQSTHEVDEGRRFTGFIAEDVAAAFPEASSDNGENYDVRALVAALWAEVRQHRTRIATLEATP